MLLEVRTVADRAATNRALLDDLLDSVPASYWARRSPADAWTAQAHLQHLATIESQVADEIARIRTARDAAWLGGSPDPATLNEARQSNLAAADGEPVRLLRERMRRNRDALLAHLASLNPPDLELTLLFPGAVDPWGAPLRWDLRRYIASWPAHDLEHAAAIRAAMATPPDLSTIAITRRLN